MTYNCKSTVSEILEVVVTLLEEAKINLENGHMDDEAYESIRSAVESLHIDVEEDDEDEEPDLFQQMGLESESMGTWLGKALNIRRR